MQNFVNVLKKYKIERWIGGLFSILIGVIFILYNSAIYAGNLDLLLFSMDFINIFMGIIMILVGSAILIIKMITKRDLMNPGALLGGLILALGIFSIVGGLFFEVLSIIVTSFPFLMLVFGGLFLVDGSYDIIMGMSKNKSFPKISIFEIVIAVVFIVLGILFLAIDAMRDAAFILTGSMLVILGIFIILDIFLKFSDKIKEMKGFLEGEIALPENEKTETLAVEEGKKNEEPFDENSESVAENSEQEAKVEEEAPVEAEPTENDALVDEVPAETNAPSEE